MAKWEKDSAEFQMFGEYYTLVKKWYDGFTDLKQAEEFTNDINSFCMKYQQTNKKCAALSKKLALTLDSFAAENFYKQI
jgi:hypothetical protein